MVKWKFKGKEVSSLKQLPQNAVGFIYILTFSDGKQYIGRKNIFSKRKRNFGKKEIQKVEDKRRKTYEIVVKESDWLNYTSSNKIIKERLNSGEVELESREIIRICFTEKQLTYFEAQALFCYGVLEHPESFYNDNILGKFYKRDLKNEETDSDQ